MKRSTETKGPISPRNAKEEDNGTLIVHELIPKGGYAEPGGKKIIHIGGKKTGSAACSECTRKID